MKNTVDVHNGNYCFVMDGPSFESLRTFDSTLLEKIIHRSKVFARMAPEDKQHLVEILQKIGYDAAFFLFIVVMDYYACVCLFIQVWIFLIGDRLPW